MMILVKTFIVKVCVKYIAMTSHVTSKEACPVCRSLGKDRSGDNLAVYSDGHKWCYACGYHVFGDAVLSFKENVPGSKQGVPEPTRNISLPADVDFRIPRKAWDFLGKYALTDYHAKKHNLMWSEFRQRLYFPIFDKHGLLGYQGRYLGEDKSQSKWYTQGDLKNILHILPSDVGSDRIVLIEDIISAIRVSDIENCMPLFGSFVNIKTVVRLSRFYGNIVVWLDKDKEKDSYKFSKMIRDLGLISSSVVTDRDPKELTREDILACLT